MSDIDVFGAGPGFICFGVLACAEVEERGEVFMGGGDARGEGPHGVAEGDGRSGAGGEGEGGEEAVLVDHIVGGVDFLKVDPCAIKYKSILHPLT